MDFNNILFPSPNFDDDLSLHTNELIFIPKIKTNKSEDKFIPALLLPPFMKTKNILLFFHGNAEDIFLARALGEELKIKLNVIKF